MTTQPHPIYPLRAELDRVLWSVAAWDKNQSVAKLKIKWCEGHLDPDDWDFDPINCAIIFANNDILAQFCLAWE